MSKEKTNFIFSLWVAKRYLFSKKSHNAINIVSAISASGVIVGTAALIAVLSVFNGFEQLIQTMFSAFDPDLKISAVEGKTFDISSPSYEILKKNRSIIAFSEVIEDMALARLDERQVPIKIVGVDENFNRVTSIDSIIYDGQFLSEDTVLNHSVVGIGVASKLGLSTHTISPLMIYAPKRAGKINLVRPESGFNQALTNISGVFVVNQPEYDDQFVIIPLHLARKLYDFNDNEVSNIQLKIAPNSNLKKVKKEIQEIVGNGVKVQDKYEQQEDFYKITNIEKWITYLILCFILLIAIFNIISSLSMLIIEKKDDIEILKNLGANNKLIKQIFLLEGWLITIIGTIIGLFFGIVLILIQQHFGILKLGGENYIVDAYPVILKFSDVIIVFISVLIMGFWAARYPVRYISKQNKM
jgi:ABC-type lipoprotein release transport system permease subunit